MICITLNKLLKIHLVLNMYSSVFKTKQIPEVKSRRNKAKWVVIVNHFLP